MKHALLLIALLIAAVLAFRVAPLAWAADPPVRYEANCEFVRARPVGGYLQVCRLKDTVSGLCYLTVGDAGVTPVKCE